MKMYAGLIQKRSIRSWDKKFNDNKSKTSIAAQLENNLIIDLEGGSTFIDAMAIQCRNIKDLGEAAQAIREKNKEVGGNFYKHITIDNATRLEDICLSYAATLYRQSPFGAKWTGTDYQGVVVTNI